MQLIRIITLPFLPIYAFITGLRTWSYNKGIIKSNSFDIPIITVGNLSVGGTGKTPHTEYLIRLLASENNIGVLSRGYRRKTEGYLEVTADMGASESGDEPLQMKRKFPEITMSVDKERLNGITSMLIEHEEIDVILLDDAFQHRAVRAGINILLTTFDEPYFKDRLIPLGDLREFRSGKKRADIIIVTKCPEELSQAEINEFKSKIDPSQEQLLCFSKIAYGKYRGYLSLKESNPSGKVVLVTGIAKSQPILKHLQSQGLEVKHVEFRDHHSFSERHIEKVKDIFDNFEATSVITTEKDATRLRSLQSIIEKTEMPISFLEITTELVHGKEVFDERIRTYVRENKNNHRISESEDKLDT